MTGTESSPACLLRKLIRRFRPRLEPRDVSTATRVSSDIVIIGGDEPEKQRWQVSTRVNLTLGEQVEFAGFGFEGLGIELAMAPE